MDKDIKRLRQEVLEVFFVGSIGIDWIFTTKLVRSIFGHTPFGAYYIYEFQGKFRLESPFAKDVVFSSAEEAMEASIKDIKSRLLELFNQPFNRGERIKGSYGWKEVEVNEKGGER